MDNDINLEDFVVSSDLHPGQINLSWRWWSTNKMPPRLQLQRRRETFPASISDGLCVFELGDPVSDGPQFWPAIQRRLYLAENGFPENNFRHAELEFHFTDLNSFNEAALGGTLCPQQVVVRIWQPEGTNVESYRIDGVRRVEVAMVSEQPWGQVETFDIIGEQEALLGQAVIRSRHAEGPPNRFEWNFDGKSPYTEFNSCTQQTLVVAWQRSFDANRGEWEHRIVLADCGLEPEIVFYYSLFQEQSDGYFRTKQGWCGYAIATGHYGLADRLYTLLPGVNQQLDEPEPANKGHGSLRLFLSIFGSTLDHARSLAEGLRSRHDIRKVQADFLPHLAHLIGWDIDRTMEVNTQRSTLRFAPELYRNIGSIPSVKALVNLYTSWDCRVKEFVHNVFLSYDPQEIDDIRLWEIYRRSYDGNTWGTEEWVTSRDQGFDGRPAAISFAGMDWAFFHSDRKGPRRIWLSQIGNPNREPYPAHLDSNVEAANSSYIDEYPTVINVEQGIWLFWDSNRDGFWRIWACHDQTAKPFSARLNTSADANLLKLTHDPGDFEDRYPTAVTTETNTGTQIWLFWQSNRRGPTDIWRQIFDVNGKPIESAMGSCQRNTTAAWRHEQPAAVVDAGNRVWLFWSADLGDRKNIYVKVFDETGKTLNDGAEFPVTEGPQRDESPSAVYWQGGVWLFWHSRCPSGRDALGAEQPRVSNWQILGQVWQWNGKCPEPKGDAFTVAAGLAGDKEPSPWVDAKEQLWLFWRSRRGARRYQSCSVNFGDKEMLANLGAFKDRVRYSYDTRDTNDAWYARDVVGLYLRPDLANAAYAPERPAALQQLLAPFLPVQVRAVIILESPVVDEYVYTYENPDAEPVREINDEKWKDSLTALTVENYSGLLDAYRDSIPGWVWLRTQDFNNPGAYPDHLTVKFGEPPIETRHRTWHSGLKEVN